MMAKDVSVSFILKVWYKICAGALFCYLPFLFYFLWGNHDWGWIKEGTPLWSGMFEGRFSQFFLPVLLFSGNILPIFSITVGLILLSLSAVLLLKLWQVPKNECFYIILGLNIVIAPYTLSWVYFAFLTVSCLFWSLVIVLGFYFLSDNFKFKILGFLLAVLLYVMALGGYPPVVNMLGTVFLTLILNDLCFNKLSLKSLFRKYIKYVVAIVLAIFIFFIIQRFFIHGGGYNTEIVQNNELLEKFYFCLRVCFNQFLDTTNFLSFFYKSIMLFLSLFAVVVLYQYVPKKIIYICFFFLCIFILLFSSVLTTFVAHNTDYVKYEPRIEFFSLPYIYTFAGVVLLKSPRLFIKNITLLLFLFILLYNFSATAFAFKVWKFGFDSENKLSERVVSRIESHPDFNPITDKYSFIQGGVLHFRERYYSLRNVSHLDSYTLTAPYLPWHLPSKAYMFYYPYEFVDNDYDVYWSFVTPKDEWFTPKFSYYIKEKAISWPHLDAMYFNDKLIVLTLTSEGRGRAIAWFEKYK